MEEKITMLHDEVVENVEEIAKADFSNVKYSIGGGMIVVGGMMTYKYLVKPMMAKRKAKKQSQGEDQTKPYAVVEQAESEMENEEE